MLNEIGYNNIEIALVSFDIFDTLLFRSCRKPEDIFRKMYNKCPKLFPEDFDSEDWVRLRRYTELNVRKINLEQRGNQEVTLKEIYEKLPRFIDTKEELKELECQTEIENCFLNDEIYEKLKNLSELGKKIVLASDMYLPQEVIDQMLLKSGVDMKYIDKVYISCEYGKSKRNKELYRLILNEYNLKPFQMLHIGDNCESDIASARQMGINTYHYGLISEGKINFPYLEYEPLAYEYIDNDTYSLRLKIGNQKDDFWYKTGAMIMGPFLSYFALWIVKKAYENDIKYIRPMMREGDFLSKLIKQASDYMQYDLNIQPLYVSRLALYKALFNEITEKEIKYLVSTYGITLEEVLDVLDIKEYAGQFSEYFSKEFKALSCISYENVSQYERILAWLLEDNQIRLIREKNRNSSDYILKYLDEIDMIGKKVLTVDIGWRGSIQKAIDQLLERNNLENKILHSVCISKSAVVANMYPYTNIIGFFGKCGSESRIIDPMLSRIYELFLLSDKGTTVGYKKMDEKIHPITKKIEYPEWQVNAIKLLQEGILDFQKEHLNYICNFSIDELKKKAKSSIAICERLMCYPTYEEVRNIKELEYDQNFGANVFSKILDEDVINEFSIFAKNEDGIKLHTTGIIWRSGLYSYTNPLYYYQLLYRINFKFVSMTYARVIKKAVERAEEREKKLTLVGAGNNLGIFLNMLSAMKKLFLVESIIDNNKLIEGACYCGIHVKQVSDVQNNSVFICTVKNKTASDSLEKQITSMVGKDIDFYAYGKE